MLKFLFSIILFLISIAKITSSDNNETQRRIIVSNRWKPKSKQCFSRIFHISHRLKPWKQPSTLQNEEVCLPERRFTKIKRRKKKFFRRFRKFFRRFAKVLTNKSISKRRFKHSETVINNVKDAILLSLFGNNVYICTIKHELIWKRLVILPIS